jgi:phospholipid/cholesterol/gamma-HCH transport system substrate-binding protein
MKLAMRFADKIVGALIILALGILIFVIFMLGSSQRWFAKDYHFKAYFNSADGLSQNMSVQYKGFTIGHVKSIELAEDDRVEVRFTIFDTYIGRVKEGSLVEVASSPIPGLGGGFMFYPGLGTEPIPEESVIHSVNSSEGKRMMAMGLAVRSEQDDGISSIMNRVNTLLGTLNSVLLEVDDAFAGTDGTTLGRTLGGIEMAVTQLPADVSESINRIVAQIDPILENVNSLSEKIADPDGTISAVLDSDREVYAGLASSLESVSGILKSLDKTVEFVPSQLPQVAGLLTDVNIALRTVQDVLTAVANNPLLKGGVPERKETRAGGAQSRDIEF